MRLGDIPGVDCERAAAQPWPCGLPNHWLAVRPPQAQPWGQQQEARDP